MDLNELITDKIDELNKEGFIQDQIDKQCRLMIQDVVKSLLEYYGPIGKKIKEHYKDAFEIDDYKIDLPSYNNFILDVAEKEFARFLEGEATEKFREQLNNRFPKVNKTEKISTLISIIEENWEGIARENQSEYIRVKVDDSRENSIYVTFRHPEYKSDDIKVTFYNHVDGHPDDGWTIGYINEDRKSMTGRTTRLASNCWSDIAEVFYRYYIAKTRFTFDQDFEDIYIGY